MRFLLSTILTSILLNAIEMPPMPPMMDIQMKPSAVNNKEIKKNKPAMPKECELLPPMVIMLPPPMENMVGKCKNELLKPDITKNKNIEKLFGKNSKVESINSVESFNNLYEIKVNKKSYLCNKELTLCFEKSKMIKVGK